MHRLAEVDSPAIGLLLAGQHAKEGGLAGAVRADHADDAAGRQLEGEVLDEQRVAIAFGEALDVDDVLPEALAGRDDDLRGAGSTLLVPLEELVIGADTRLRLRLAGARARRDPFALAVERPLAGGLLAALLREAFRLLLEIDRVITLIGNAAAAVELEDP